MFNLKFKIMKSLLFHISNLKFIKKINSILNLFLQSSNSKIFLIKDLYNIIIFLLYFVYIFRFFIIKLNYNINI